uniref:(northern house mosquito) hypothetical protein n=1 Tax=Culex pipiens TaxID=7175 RepID=A0A8D8MCX4_CULPI
MCVCVFVPQGNHMLIVFKYESPFSNDLREKNARKKLAKKLSLCKKKNKKRLCYSFISRQNRTLYIVSLNRLSQTKKESPTNNPLSFSLSGWLVLSLNGKIKVLCL